MPKCTDQRPRKSNVLNQEPESGEGGEHASSCCMDHVALRQ